MYQIIVVHIDGGGAQHARLRVGALRAMRAMPAWSASQPRASGGSVVSRDARPVATAKTGGPHTPHAVTLYSSVN